MPFVFQLQGNKLVAGLSGSQGRTLAQSVPVKAGTTPPESFVFLDGDTLVLQPAGTIIQVGAKPAGQFDTPALTLTEFTAGRPAVTVPQVDYTYTATADYRAPALFAAMGLGDGTPTDDLPGLNLQLEARFKRPGDTNWTPSVNAVALIVSAPVLGEGDYPGPPPAADPPYPSAVAVVTADPVTHALTSPTATQFYVANPPPSAGSAVSSVNGQAGMVVVATTAQGAKADTAVQPAGLTSALMPYAPKTYVDTAVAGSLARSANLSDLANAATARANLGANDAGNITQGTLPDARLSANVPRLDYSGTLAVPGSVTTGSGAFLSAFGSIWVDDGSGGWQTASANFAITGGGGYGNPNGFVSPYGDGTFAGTITATAFSGAVAPNTFTFGTVPDPAAAGAGYPIYVIDADGGPNAFWSDGTDWRDAARNLLAD